MNDVQIAFLVGMIVGGLCVMIGYLLEPIYMLIKRKIKSEKDNV